MNQLLCELVLSRIHELDDSFYGYGFFGEEGLYYDGDSIVSVSEVDNGLLRIDCNLKTHEMNISKKNEDMSSFLPITHSTIDSGTVIDITNQGLRWEGSSLNNSPYGYGSLINENNETIYQGFMINDDYVCFGVEFFPDLSRVCYCGCYWKKKRHGYGVLYNRKEELIYEGDYFLDNTNMEKRISFESTSIDEDSLNSLCEELIVDFNCFNSLYNKVKISGWKNLKYLNIGNRCFISTDKLILESSVLSIIELLIFLN